MTESHFLYPSSVRAYTQQFLRRHTHYWAHLYHPTSSRVPCSISYDKLHLHITYSFFATSFMSATKLGKASPVMGEAFPGFAIPST